MLPKEHGAWAMLLVPFAAGVHASGGASLKVLLGLIGSLSLYLSRPPLMLLLKRRRLDGSYGAGSSALWLNFFLAATLGLGAFAWLTIAYSLWFLPAFGVAGFLLFVPYTQRALKRKERSVAGELVGLLMLTLTAPLGAYLVTEQLNRQALSLWLLNVAYFGASIFFVKAMMRLSARKQTGFVDRLALARGSLIYLALLAALLAASAALAWIPAWAPLAFLPMGIHMLRSLAVGQPAPLKIEGLIQTGLALFFLIVLVVSYRL